MPDQPQFRRALDGEREPFEAEVDETEVPAPPGRHLTAHWVVLANGARLRQHRPARGQYRSQGYDRLDSEILAGRQLCDVTGRGCPPEVSQFFGDDDGTAAADEPFTLFEPYRGAPLSETELINEERPQFQVSLLRGLCWLAAAGIAHRALNPETVWWDGERRQAQITDFSLSLVFGAPRTPLPGQEAWIPRDQREITFKAGPVGERDDVWAAARLIFHVWNDGAPVRSRADLAHGGLDELLGDAFGAPDTRPPASELLRRLGETNPAPSWSSKSAEWRRERELFLKERKRLHRGVSDSLDFYADLGGSSNPASSYHVPAAEVPAAGTQSAGAVGSADPWSSTGRNDASRRWPSRRRQGEK
jgi:serine/threonine protein kinase